MKPDTLELSAYPKCRECGKRDYHIDQWMNKRDTTPMTCSCNAYHFPHRRGSFFCWFRVDGTDRFPGDKDFRHRDMPDYPTEIAA